MEHLRAPSVTTGLFSIGWRLDGDLFPRPFVVISNFFSFFFLSFCCFPASMFADKGRAKRIDTCAFHRGMPNATVLFTQKENLIEIYIYIYILDTLKKSKEKESALWSETGKEQRIPHQTAPRYFPIVLFPTSVTFQVPLFQAASRTTLSCDHSIELLLYGFIIYSKSCTEPLKWPLSSDYFHSLPNSISDFQHFNYFESLSDGLLNNI